MNERDFFEMTGGQMGLSVVTRLQSSGFMPPWTTTFSGYFRGNNFIMYRERGRGKPKHELTEAQRAALSEPKFTGVMSKKTQNKLIDILQNWQDTIDHYQYVRLNGSDESNRDLRLLTLTLSAEQRHSDTFIKRNLLNTFLICMVTKQPCIKYLWKAETQKNGNIHFHIIIDRFLHKEWVLDQWNKIQRTTGYAPQRDIVELRKLCPSTRIESLRDKDSGINYVAKYVCKNDGNRKIEGRLWSCSRELTKLKRIDYPLSKMEVEEIVKMGNYALKSGYMDEYCVIVPLLKDYKKLKSQLMLKHNCVQITLENNIDILNLRSLCAEFEIEESEYYRELMGTPSGLQLSYLFENDMLYFD